ncbi:primosomal protein N' [Galbitalea soli]|uniref:Probable replication restart protein PriA n=1 Tax=Galbitalea soli TaxID=1268042 RepID=A0A7C9TQC4_9MICO|nr:primosomal protein N' [Galbitalea soli]NEM90203.1 primosomal protein N' [Galbitalea soli]NYJ30911.1 primosomal protein N' (replication factor Y) [Galbitalea soli]
MTTASIARVLVDSPLPQLDRLFDYRVPDALAAEVRVGVRVRVPLRSAGRIADGFVVELVEHGEFAGALSDIDAVTSPVPVLAPEVYQLARRAADRAAGAASDIVRLAVPGRQARVEKALLAAGPRPPADAVARPALVAPIADYPVGRVESAIAGGARLALDAVPLVTRTRSGDWVGRWATTAAACAVAALASGQSAILAVPDYRDQEQLAAALADVLPPEAVVRLDARQSNPDRYRAFLRCLESEPVVIIGNRSVVYAPAARLGLILIWDDGDPLHTEPLAPYVHSRDAALLRQELQSCALIVIGHSRSTEVERLVEIGWMTAVTPAPAVLPKVIPTAQQPATDRLAAQARIPSSAWQAARSALESGPVLVQVARPGYAPRLACADCGQSARCRNCEGPLAQKSSSAPPACTWCGALAVGWRCQNCEGTRQRLVGAGATRTAEDLGRAFPGVRVLVADGERPLLAVDDAPALVIATRGAEPIAAGGYRAVLLLDGERMIARESLRVAEDCLRWWSNAIALAARGAPTILVGVGGPIASALATWRQSDFVRAELNDRRALRFPPAVRVATLTGTLESVTRAVAAVAPDPVDVLGPVDLGPGSVRTIIRFDYNNGAAYASALRAEVVRSATSRRKAAAVKGPRPPLGPTLRVRFDDIEPFLDA